VLGTLEESEVVEEKVVGLSVVGLSVGMLVGLVVARSVFLPFFGALDIFGAFVAPGFLVAPSLPFFEALAFFGAFVAPGAMVAPGIVVDLLFLEALALGAFVALGARILAARTLSSINRVRRSVAREGPSSSKRKEPVVVDKKINKARAKREDWHIIIAVVCLFVGRGILWCGVEKHRNQKK
jgi:hypothetical protein